jgi:hypothetical protein
MGWYVFAGVHGNALVWTLNPETSNVPTWLLRLWYPWGGQTYGSVVTLTRSVNDPHGARTLKHEQAHVLQYMKLGVFFPILYGLFCLTIVIACPTLNYYEDNIFEHDAKQSVKLT